MGFFTRLAVTGATRTAQAGVAVARMVARPPPFDTLERMADRAIASGALDEPTTENLEELVEGKKRQALFVELNRLVNAGVIERPHGLDHHASPTDVRVMTTAARNAVGMATEKLVDGVEQLPRTVSPIDVDELTAKVGGFLESIDAKYRDADPAKVRARVEEFVVSTSLGTFYTDKKMLRRMGFSPEVVARVGSVKSLVELAKKNEKARAEGEATLGQKADALAEEGPPTRFGALNWAVGKCIGRAQALSGALESVGAEQEQGLAKESGWALARALGIDLTDLPPEATQVALDEFRRLANKRLSQVRSLANGLHANRNALASMLVNLARRQRVNPVDFFEAMMLVEHGIDRATESAMAGREAVNKLKALPELKVALVQTMDILLEHDGDFRTALSEGLGVESKDMERTARAVMGHLRGRDGPLRRRLRLPDERARGCAR